MYLLSAMIIVYKLKNTIFLNWGEKEYYLCRLKRGRMLSLLTEVRKNIIFVDWSEEECCLCRLTWKIISSLSTEVRKNIIYFDWDEKKNIIFVDWGVKEYYLFRKRRERILSLSTVVRKNIICVDWGGTNIMFSVWGEEKSILSYTESIVMDGSGPGTSSKLKNLETVEMWFIDVSPTHCAHVDWENTLL